MDVQSTLRYTLIKYPELFKNKWGVYHHLFVVNGNGFEWIGGELVEKCDELNILSTYDAIEYKLDSFKKSYIEFIEKYNFTSKHLVLQLSSDVNDILNIEKRITDLTQSEEFYGLCEYSKIVNLPNYIKEDWKLALQEFYNFLIENISKFEEEDKKFIALIDTNKFK